MNEEQYTNVTTYLSHYSLTSRRRSRGLTQPHQPAAHTLPPSTSDNDAAPTFGNDAYPIRSQPLQSPVMTTPHEQASQPGSYPIYAPTSSMLYNGQSANFSQAPQSQQLHQQSTPSSSNGIQQLLYNPAPTQVRLPDLAPMPPRGSGKMPLSIGTQMNQLDSVDEPQPTHVVGSQGRRGILPSAAGRPAAVAGANTSGQKAAPTPPKDADGKYPCQYCNKNYLHSKHLKRHLLRHTGVRPYTCGLCKDTFSRSDILKRHFMKCSVRRGNPSGENHLSHSRRNRRSRQAEAARRESSTPTGVNQANDMEVYTPSSLNGAFNLTDLNLGPSQFAQSSNENSRPSSVQKGSTASHSNRASLGMVNTTAYDPANYSYMSGAVTPDSATESGAATPYNYLHESNPNQISPSGPYNTANGSDMGFNGVNRASTSSIYNNGSLPHIAGQSRGHDIDWAYFSNHNTHDDYGNTQYHSGTNTPHRIKSETDLSNIDIGDYPYHHPKA